MAVVIICAQFQRAPLAKAWQAVKRVIRYLKGTLNVGFRVAPTALDIVAFSDASHGDSSVGCHSITGCLIFLGGALVHWISRKQKTIAHSSAEHLLQCEPLWRCTVDCATVCTNWSGISIQVTGG